MMRVLFIGKRFYTNRDAYTERFGMIYQLPFWWAKAGHEVDLWLAGRSRVAGSIDAQSVECTRAERVSAYRDREASDGLRCSVAGRSLYAGTSNLRLFLTSPCSGPSCPRSS